MSPEGFMHSGIRDNPVIMDKCCNIELPIPSADCQKRRVAKCVLHGLEVSLISLVSSYNASLSLIALSIKRHLPVHLPHFVPNNFRLPLAASCPLSARNM